MRRAQVGDLLLDRGLLVALALLDLLVDALGLGADDRAQLRGGGPCRPCSPAATMTSPVGSKTIDSSAAPVLSSASRASTAWAAATISSVRLARWASSSALVAVERGRSARRDLRSMSALSSVLEVGQALAGLAAAAGGLLLDVGGEPLARLLVDARDDVQGEVQDPLEVARADVEQDAEAARACP